MKKVFLVRHANYRSGDDPGISDDGRNQSQILAQKIKAQLGDGDVVIWSSSAKRARETAEIIQKNLQPASMVVEEKLWSDNKHRHDFAWLKEKLNGFKEGNLIIVSHLEYVNDFPAVLGYGTYDLIYAQGVLITDDGCQPVW